MVPIMKSKAAIWGYVIGGLLTIASLTALVTLGSQMTFDSELDAAEKRIEKESVETFRALQREQNAKFELHILDYYNDQIREIKRYLAENPNDQRAIEDLSEVRMKRRKARERLEKMK